MEVISTYSSIKQLGGCHQQQQQHQVRNYSGSV
jgi:hypothetical protein